MSERESVCMGERERERESERERETIRTTSEPKISGENRDW